MTVSATLPTGEVRSNAISYPDYADLRDRAQSFEGLTATDLVSVAFARRRDESARGTYGLAVSANFFDVLHVRPALGRAFVPDEDRVAGRDAVIILSHETWTQQFGADANIVGREIRLTGEPFTVIGVTPEGFTGPDHFLPPHFYVPLAMLPKLSVGAQTTLLDQRDNRTLEVMGRLKPEVSLAQASEEVDRIGRALAQEYPAANRRRGLLLRREMDQRMAENPPTAALSFILIGLAVAILLVACANVAGLLTSRAPVRPREIAMRLAIGGSRGRLMRQLITESALVALAGAVAGLALGYIGILSFRQLQIVSDVGVRLTYELDRRAVAVGLGIAAISALLSSVIPAWRSTRARDLTSILRNTTVPAGRAARLWGRHGLVASQIALTLVLLSRALLLSCLRGRVRPRSRISDRSPSADEYRYCPRSIRSGSKRGVLSALEGRRGGDSEGHVGRAHLVCAVEPGHKRLDGHRPGGLYAAAGHREPDRRGSARRRDLFRHDRNPNRNGTRYSGDRHR